MVAIDGNHAVVNIGGVSGCPACDAGKGCGAGIFGRLLRDRKVDVRVPNSIDAITGQSVNLGITERRFLALVFALYVWPLLAGLLGVIAAFVIAARVGLSGMNADLAGLLAGIAAAAWALFRSRRKLREFPYAAEVHLLENAVAGEAEPCPGKAATVQLFEPENEHLNEER